MSLALISAPEMLTCARLNELLRSKGILRDASAIDIRFKPIGNGLMCDSVRFEITYDREQTGAPATLAGKFSPMDPNLRANGPQSIHITEVRFYQEIAPTVAVSAPRAFYAEVDTVTTDFGIIMEDMAPARGGDQLVGASIDDCFLALDQAAALHGPRWNDPALKNIAWLQANRATFKQMMPAFQSFLTVFQERFGDVLEAEYMQLCEQLMPKVGEFLLRDPPTWTTVHNDFRVDNMLFEAKDGNVPMTVLDWQTLGLGSGALDVAYFLGLNIPIETRRAREREMLDYYRDRLGSHGAGMVDSNQLWHEYRISAYYGLVTAILATNFAKRTPRGDQVFLMLTRGACAQMRDLETLSALSKSF